MSSRTDMVIRVSLHLQTLRWPSGVSFSLESQELLLCLKVLSNHHQVGTAHQMFSKLKVSGKFCLLGICVRNCYLCQKCFYEMLFCFVVVFFSCLGSLFFFIRSLYFLKSYWFSSLPPVNPQPSEALDSSPTKHGVDWPLLGILLLVWGCTTPGGRS